MTTNSPNWPLLASPGAGAGEGGQGADLLCLTVAVLNQPHPCARPGLRSCSLILAWGTHRDPWRPPCPSSSPLLRASREHFRMLWLILPLPPLHLCGPQETSDLPQRPPPVPCSPARDPRITPGGLVSVPLGSGSWERLCHFCPVKRASCQAALMPPPLRLALLADLTPGPRIPATGGPFQVLSVP